MIGDILQPTHLLFILVIALLVLGPKRLPEVGRALGRGLRDFRNALNTDDLREHMLSTTSMQTTTPTEQEPTAYSETPLAHESPAATAATEVSPTAADPVTNGHEPAVEPPMTEHEVAAEAPTAAHEPAAAEPPTIDHESPATTSETNQDADEPSASEAATAVHPAPEHDTAAPAPERIP